VLALPAETTNRIFAISAALIARASAGSEVGPPQLQFSTIFVFTFFWAMAAVTARTNEETNPPAATLPGSGKIFNPIICARQQMPVMARPLFPRAPITLATAVP